MARAPEQAHDAPTHLPIEVQPSADVAAKVSGEGKHGVRARREATATIRRSRGSPRKMTLNPQCFGQLSRLSRRRVEVRVDVAYLVTT